MAKRKCERARPGEMCSKLPVTKERCQSSGNTCVVGVRLKRGPKMKDNYISQSSIEGIPQRYHAYLPIQSQPTKSQTTAESFLAATRIAYAAAMSERRESMLPYPDRRYSEDHYENKRTQSANQQPRISATFSAAPSPGV
jgi:hypothetical protein